MGNFLFRLVAGLCLIVLATAQFKMAGHGKPCLDYSPFEPMRVCETDKGLDCLGTSTKYDRVCSCYGTFVFDKKTQECRRKVGDVCQPFNERTEPKRLWNEKCQGDAECSEKGVCVCKPGYVKSPFSFSCVLPGYLREAKKAKVSNQKLKFKLKKYKYDFS